MDFSLQHINAHKDFLDKSRADTAAVKAPLDLKNTPTVQVNVKCPTLSTN